MDSTPKTIREHRLAKGLTQRQLGIVTDLDSTALSAYENGRKVPSVSTLRRIAAALGVSSDAIRFDHVPDAITSAVAGVVSESAA